MKILILSITLTCLISCSKSDTINTQEELVVSEDQDSDTEEETPQDEDTARTTGSDYCDSYTVSEPISLVGLKDTIISGLDISNPNGVAIVINSCENLTIENCFLHDSSGNGIQIYGSSNIIIQNNKMESISTGVYAQVSQGIQVLNNDIKNVLGPFPRGQFVQFADCTGANNKINYNAFQNIEGQSYGEDAINLFNSYGTVDSPIEVRGNWIKNFTPSLTGGGIMTGDSGGSFITVAENILVDNGPYGYGIGIASGTDIVIENNTLVGRNKLNQYVPVFMTNFYPDQQSCSRNTIRDNQTSWRDSQDRYILIDYRADVCETPIGLDTNNMQADIDESVLPENIFEDCQTTAD